MIHLVPAFASTAAAAAAVVNEAEGSHATPRRGHPGGQHTTSSALTTNARARVYTFTHAQKHRHYTVKVNNWFPQEAEVVSSFL